MCLLCFKNLSNNVNKLLSVFACRLAIVDLAGSESTRKTGETKTRVKGASSINNSVM